MALDRKIAELQAKRDLEDAELQAKKSTITSGLNEVRGTIISLKSAKYKIIGREQGITEDERKSLEDIGAIITLLGDNYVHRLIDDEKPRKNGC
jgi:16S rRNA U1498 N3-methylase RsmE